MTRRIRTPSPRARQSGFSLLEVLIAVLVLTIGLLGLAGLQSLSLKYNHSAYIRSQAVQLAYDMADRVRANPGSLDEFPTASGPDDSGLFDGEDFADLPADPDCIADLAGCAQVADIAAYDFRLWNHHILDTLPDGYGVIYRPVGSDQTLEIAVRWREQVDLVDEAGNPGPDGNPDLQTFVLRFHP